MPIQIDPNHVYPVPGHLLAAIAGYLLGRPLGEALPLYNGLMVVLTPSPNPLSPDDAPVPAGPNGG
jgi:hypothetical protein